MRKKGIVSRLGSSAPPICSRARGCRRVQTSWDTTPGINERHYMNRAFTAITTLVVTLTLALALAPSANAIAGPKPPPSTPTYAKQLGATAQSDERYDPIVDISRVGAVTVAGGNQQLDVLITMNDGF